MKKKQDLETFAWKNIVRAAVHDDSVEWSASDQFKESEDDDDNLRIVNDLPPPKWPENIRFEKMM